MLEVDDESRLGRELIAGGARYHAHFVPDEDTTADFYEQACEMLEAAGVKQYEISNFAGSEEKRSIHNLKYWTRQPYIGFGVDAHSMLKKTVVQAGAVRFATPDSLDSYMNRTPPTVTPVSQQAAVEESFFLGLRLNGGVDLAEKRCDVIHECAIDQCIQDGLLEQEGTIIRLTPRGRLLSNEVFARFLADEVEETKVGTGNVNPR
jgi:oxygen-independent coproporphyrinogen III oxidase